MERILIDTNILVYYADKTNLAKYEHARNTMDEVRQNPIKYTISWQNLREFANVMVSKTKMPAEEINAFIREFYHAFSPILPFDALEELSSAVQRSRQNTAWFCDTLLAETMRTHGISTIYTEDTTDFEKIPGMKVINPLK